MMPQDSLSTIPGLPEMFQRFPGVQMVPPPADVLAQTTQLVIDAANTLQPGENGALVWIASTKGINVAAVHRVGEKFAVTAWVGKTYGQPLSAGVAGTLRW